MVSCNSRASTKYTGISFHRTHGKSYINNDLKELLLEFTLNALLDQPEEVVPFAKDYFAKLGQPSLLSSEESTSQQDARPSGEYTPDMFVRTRGRVVYSEAYNPEKDSQDSQTDLAFHHKNHVIQKKLMDVCKKCVLFKNLDRDHLIKVVNAMFQRAVEPDEYVIQQGEDGDNFYIIDSGTYDVFIDGNYITTYENEGSFGDLALMYNMPRSATVQAKSKGKLWALDRTTFRKIVLKGVYKKRKLYEDFLNSVPMLQTMTHYERMNVADALVSKTYQENDVIIQEGEDADGMYFVEEGKVVINLAGSGNFPTKVRMLKVGDYFGELALVTRKPRAATVTAYSHTVKCAFLDIEAFERVLGPCMQLLERNIEMYKQDLAHIIDMIKKDN